MYFDKVALKAVCTCCKEQFKWAKAARETCALDADSSQHRGPEEEAQKDIESCEPLSKLLVSPLMTPIVLPYIIPYVYPL